MPSGTADQRNYARSLLGQPPAAASAEKALRELLSAKADVEYGVGLVTRARAEILARRARTLVELAVQSSG